MKTAATVRTKPASQALAVSVASLTSSAGRDTEKVSGATGGERSWLPFQRNNMPLSFQAIRLLPSHPLLHQPGALKVVLERHPYQVSPQNSAKPDGVHFPAQPDRSHLRPGWIRPPLCKRPQRCPVLLLAIRTSLHGACNVLVPLVRAGRPGFAKFTGNKI
jgi:hypothetical protein